MVDPDPDFDEVPDDFSELPLFDCLFTISETMGGRDSSDDPVPELEVPVEVPEDVPVELLFFSLVEADDESLSSSSATSNLLVLEETFLVSLPLQPRITGKVAANTTALKRQKIFLDMELPSERDETDPWVVSQVAFVRHDCRFRMLLSYGKSVKITAPIETTSHY